MHDKEYNFQEPLSLLLSLLGVYLHIITNKH